ncbi:MAG: 50S ribosomal protein L4 [bacterium]
MKLTTYTSTGEKKEDSTMKLSIFDAPVNPALIHEVVVAQLANRRLATAKTKTRGEISGGGKKPYRQKGTGRARTGSIRNPIWKGGGTTFGPTGEQNYTQLIPAKKRRVALISALSTKKEDVSIVEEIKAEKTKDFVKIIEKIIQNKKGLLVYPKLTEKDILVSRNLKKIKASDYRNLNVYDVLNSQKIVFVGNALELTNEFLGK